MTMMNRSNSLLNNDCASHPSYTTVSVTLHWILPIL